MAAMSPYAAVLGLVLHVAIELALIVRVLLRPHRRNAGPVALMRSAVARAGARRMSANRAAYL